MAAMAAMAASRVCVPSEWAALAKKTERNETGGRFGAASDRRLARLPRWGPPRTHAQATEHRGALTRAIALNGSKYTMFTTTVAHVKEENCNCARSPVMECESSGIR